MTDLPEVSRSQQKRGFCRLLDRAIFDGRARGSAGGEACTFRNTMLLIYQHAAIIGSSRWTCV
jgi:hypothetical protein